MIRVTKMSGKWYGIKIFSLMKDHDNIMQFIREGTPVVIVDNLEDVEELGINPAEVEMVEPA